MGGNKTDELGSISAKLTSPFLQTRYYIHLTAYKLSISAPDRQSYPEKLDMLLPLNSLREENKKG